MAEKVFVFDDWGSISFGDRNFFLLSHIRVVRPWFSPSVLSSSRRATMNAWPASGEFKNNGGYPFDDGGSKHF
jgi:hypothetical protein